jgi:hypothetical protein
MTDAVNRFIDNTLRQFLKKEYSAEKVVRNLREDIRKLSEYLISNEPDTLTWREKAQLLKEKRDELEVIKKENSLT